MFVRSKALGSIAALLILGAMTLPTGCANVAGGGGGAPRVDLAFEKYTLPNGLEVILRKDSRLPLVSVNVWYHVGPAKEAAQRTGFAHLFEHMMFQGSGNVGEEMHFRHLETAGASFVNGTTSLDRTNYMEDLPSNQLELALWLESDRMGFLLDLLDQTMLSNQQDVVRNERRQSIENAPYGLAEETVYQLLFPAGHPYHAAVIGSHADIQAAQLADVRDFFTRYYAPNNATIAIVGDIEIDKAKALVEKYFATLPKGPDVEPVTVQTPPITAERRLVLTDQVELPRVYMAWETPPFFKPGDAEADVAARILGGGKASRLYKSLVYERKIAQDVTAYQQSAELTSIFQISVTAKPGHTADEIEAAIVAEIDSLGREGPTPEELASTRNAIHTQMITSLENLGAVADRLNLYNHYVDDPAYLNKDLQRYSDVTAAAVRDFASRYLTHDSRVVIQVVPGEKVLPAAPPTPPVPPKVAKAVETREPWRKQVPVAAEAAASPLPGAKRFDLDNGLAVYLVESHVLPIVTAQLAVRAGSSADPAGAHGLAGFTLSMLDEGTAKRDALTIARELESLGATLSTDMGRDGCSLTVQSLTRNHQAALELLADCLLAPAFAEHEVERVRTDRLTSLLQDRDSPTRIAYKVMWRDLYGPSHPYGHMVIGNESTLKSVKRTDLEDFYKSVFVPANSALVLAGDLTEAQARKLAKDVFGGWNAKGGEIEPPPVETAGAPERVLIVDKPATPQTTVLVAEVGVPRSEPDYEKLNVMNQVLGGLFSSRVNLNLREKHGYTYGAYSSLPENRGAGPYVLGADVRADATGASVREIMKEVDGIRAAPVGDDELATAKQSIGRSLPAYFQSSASTAATVGNLFLLDLPPDYYQGLPGRLESVTAEQVFEATKKHLNPERMKVIAVGDRKHIEPQLAALKLGAIGYRTLDGEPVSGDRAVAMPLP